MTLRFLGITGVIVLVAIVAAPVLAVSRGQELAPGQDVLKAAREKEKERGSEAHARTSPAVRSQGGEEAPGRQRSCAAHEQNVQKRSGRITRMASHMLDVFANIAERVQTYYTTVVVPGGQTVANYDALVADIAAKRTAVATAVGQAQATAGSFSCETDNPKSLLRQFRLDMKEVMRALKAYRTSKIGRAHV